MATGKFYNNECNKVDALNKWIFFQEEYRQMNRERDSMNVWIYFEKPILSIGYESDFMCKIDRNSIAEAVLSHLQLIAQQ